MRSTKLPFVSGSDTSHAAAVSMDDDAPNVRERVFMAFVIAGERGLTCDEAEEKLDLRHQTCSARVHELSRKGRIVDSENRRRTRSGRYAVVHIVAPTPKVGQYREGEKQGDLF